MVESPSASNADDSDAKAVTDPPQTPEEILSKPGESIDESPSVDAATSSESDFHGEARRKQTAVFSRTTSSEVVIESTNERMNTDQPPVAVANPSMAISYEEQKKRQDEKEARDERERTRKFRHLRNVLLIVLTFLVLSIIPVWKFLWIIPSENRIFASLLAFSLYLVAGGFVTLIFVIPAAGPDYELKTEFYSVRAAYFCTAAGLVLAIIVSVGMVLGGLHVLGAR